MFHVIKVDYGPIPFNFFHSWLHRNGLDEVIKSGYSNDPNCSFHSKLKSLKQRVKEWHLNTKHNERSRIQEISILLKEIEIKIDARRASEEDRTTRIDLLHEYNELEKYSEMDVLQKSHIKWDVEGDENTKYFHGLLKQKRRHQSIQGITVDGNWITEPHQVKTAFLNFFKANFQEMETPISFNPPVAYFL